MKFSDKSHNQLEVMGVNPDEYIAYLFARFPIDANVIDQLLSQFSDYPKSALTTGVFKQFIDKLSLSCDHPMYDHCFDIFNYLRMYKTGGKFELFKGRQAEWDGPIVVLEKSDVPISNLDSLIGVSEIYRGMSISEFEGSNFGQSWTTDIDVARRFAFDTYGDKPRGLVAKTRLENNYAIYYSLQDSESEIIMQSGSIRSAERIET